MATPKRKRKGLWEDGDPIPCYKIRDYYDYYINYTCHSKDHQINYNTYKKVIEECNGIIMNELIYTGKDFLIPFNLGWLKIKKQKINPDNKKILRNHIDKELTEKYGKKIYNLYEETNGYFPYIRYFYNVRTKRLLLSYYRLFINQEWKDKMKLLFSQKKTDYQISHGYS